MPASPAAILSLLATACFALTGSLLPWHQAAGARNNSAGVLQVLLGDTRRAFASHFFVKADTYYHNGFSTPHSAGDSHMAEQASSDADEKHADHDGHETSGAHNWLERFGRNFYPSRHSHIERAGDEREILPWLRIAAELDPHKPDTYTVTAYWLRQHLGRVDEAEQFLREGLRQNPDSFEILFELGRLLEENRKDTLRARSLWEQALRKWTDREAAHGQPDKQLLALIAGHLAQIEEREGRLVPAVYYYDLLRRVSKNPDAVRKTIDELHHRIAAGEAAKPPSK
ncbi:MAG: tetratricopeptide repeat protein [Verrucomicrobia bacterium]|nr:tetratricopeptide repeat protein [Verrucomicrobiota bacterium]